MSEFKTYSKTDFSRQIEILKDKKVNLKNYIRKEILRIFIIYLTINAIYILVTLSFMNGFWFFIWFTGNAFFTIFFSFKLFDTSGRMKSIRKVSVNYKDDFYFYIQAGPDQKNISREIINNVDKKNCMDLSDLSVREILPFFSLCDAYVGNDSFMHHVTSQSQKPAIVLLINSPKAYTDYSKNYYRILSS